MQTDEEQFDYSSVDGNHAAVKARHKEIISEFRRQEDFREYEDKASDLVWKAEAKKLEEIRQAQLYGKMPRKRRKKASTVIGGPSTSKAMSFNQSLQIGDSSASSSEQRSRSQLPKCDAIYESDTEHFEK